jgi:hypothetical protein
LYDFRSAKAKGTAMKVASGAGSKRSNEGGNWNESPAAIPAQLSNDGGEPSVVPLMNCLKTVVEWEQPGAMAPVHHSELDLTAVLDDTMSPHCSPLSVFGARFSPRRPVDVRN